jgi:hypothetical protein
MRHEAQIPLDQDIPRLHVSPGCAFKVFLFFLPWQGLGKGARRIQAKRAEHGHYENCRRKQASHLLHAVYSDAVCPNDSLRKTQNPASRFPSGMVGFLENGLQGLSCN